MVALTKARYKLRAFKPEDAATLSAELCTKSIQDNMTMETPWTLEKASWWISFIDDMATKTPLQELHFAIEIDGYLAGSIGLINIIGHRCEIGYWLSSKHRNIGIITEAIGEVVAKAPAKLGLKRIFAPILPYNKASARVLEKNGFELEGILKKYYFKNGKYIDAYCYAWVR